MDARPAAADAAATGAARLHRWVLDPATGAVVEQPLDDRAVEFPTCDDARVGRVALLAGTVAAGIRIGWVAVRVRSWNLFATVMLVSFAIGLGLAFVSGDPRFLLLKHSIMGSAVALTFLVAAAVSRPITLAAAQAWTPDRAEALATEYQDNPDVRRGHRVASLVWGFGLLTEALIRVPLICLLPISVMVGLSTAMMVTAFTVLIAWTARYSRRAQAGAGRAGAGVR